MALQDGVASCRRYMESALSTSPPKPLAFFCDACFPMRTTSEHTGVRHNFDLVALFRSGSTVQETERSAQVDRAEKRDPDTPAPELGPETQDASNSQAKSSRAMSTASGAICPTRTARKTTTA